MNADLQNKVKRKKETESSQKRGPFLCFNKTPKLSSRITNVSSSSSSSSSTSSSTVEASNSCLHFLPASRTSSSASSRSAPQKKPKSISSTKSANLNSKCSKENISPRPTSQKPQKNVPCRSRKKPVPGTSQKPGPCADLASSGKKSSFRSRLISANDGNPKSRGNDSGKQPTQLFNTNNSSSDSLDRTPVGKYASGSGLDCNFDDKKIDESTHSSASIVKTPPIEPSVSPEIPYGLSQKLVMASAATPCYGAGHVLSGVTDKRKCRPRGVLTVAPVLDLSSRSGKSSESDNKSRTSFVPLPVEASMCWMSSSPPDISGNGQFCGLMGSNPSITINPLKPREGSVLGGCVYARLTPTCSNPSRVEKNDSPHSTSTLSCGNVIQTPNSDCELGFQYELDEATDILRSASLSSSAQNQMPDSDDPGTSFKFSNCNSTTAFSFIGHTTKCHKHGDTSVSCLSESSTGNASESNMRVSWRDVSLSRIPAMDSCRWLPDDEEDEDEEKENGSRSDDHQIKPPQSFEGSDDLEMEKVLKLPEFLEQEPYIYNNGMEKMFPQRPGSCAESIFTDDCRGGGLVSSADSDWNL